MSGAGGFIRSHLFEKLLMETPHEVLAVDVYSDKIKNLLQPPPEHGRIQFHRLNIKNDSRLEGLIKMSDLVPPLQLPLSPLFSADPPLRREDQAPLRVPAWSTAGSSSTDSTSRTTTDSRASSRFRIWLSIALKIASGSFTSLLARCTERLLEAFSQRITLCDSSPSGRARRKPSVPNLLFVWEDNGKLATEGATLSDRAWNAKLASRCRQLSD